MASKIEGVIVSFSLPALLMILMIGLFSGNGATGLVTSDGSYISPTSDNNYKSPTSDNSYESPTAGPGYVAPKIDESWEAPKEGSGFVKPEIGPGFLEPEVGDGFERIGTYNVSFNESGDKIIQTILELPKGEISEKKNDSAVKNDPKKPKMEPKGPIDEASIGGWKVYQETHYYKKGGSKFASPTVSQMNLHDDGTWDYRGHEGTWEAAEITEKDWEKWGMKSEKFNKKLIFHGWPDGIDRTAEGPIEDTSYGARYLWAVYNAEPPETEHAAQVWKRFVAAPYVPKVTKEDDTFSELSLIGKWAIHFIPLKKNEKGQWVKKSETTTILELKSDKTWAFGTSSGKWSMGNIESDDWKKWSTQPYGPRKKIVLDNFGDDGASGPIEADKGQVSFFWLIYHTTNPENGKQLYLQRKFRPYENAVNYLTGEVKGSGTIQSEDDKINCAKQDKEPSAGCVAEYSVNEEIEINAIPENGWVFLKWSGACEGSETTCKVTMDKSKTVTAEFAPGCNDDSACSSDQRCESSGCVPLECECGYAQEHQCQKYECCDKSNCGEGQICDKSAHKCLLESACREFVIKGSPSEKHDVVFVGDGFDDYKVFRQLLVYLVDYEGQYNGMFSFSPFKENKEKFNFWMVLAPDYQHWDDGEPVNEDIERFVKTCERDTVVVISRNTYRAYAFFPTSGNKGGRAYVSLGFAAIRGSDYAAEYAGRLLLHEFGHAFGGLTDEYIEYGKGTRKDINKMPNCATSLEEAKEKWSDLVGVKGVDYYTGVPDVAGTKYFKNPFISVPEIGPAPDGTDMGDGGCSYEAKNIRPTTSSIMKNQFEPGYDFGPVNERTLAKKLGEYK